MRILVIGAGALGGYFGACLVRAGRDVTFMVRPRRAEQLARDGLRIVSPHGDFEVPVTTALAGTIGEPFDLILVGVKSYSLDEAMDQFAPAVGPDSTILPVLNGIGHLDRLIARFGAAPVVGGMHGDDGYDDFQAQMAEYFKSPHKHPPTVPETAAYYRAKNIAAVIFPVDAERETGFRRYNNYEMLEVASDHLDVLIPFVSIDPHKGKLGVREARKLIEEYGVRGFKFHPTMTKRDSLSR